MLDTQTHETKGRFTRCAAALLLSVFSTVASAQDTPSGDYEPVCNDEVKHEIAKILADSPTQKKPLSEEAFAFQKEIYAKYAFCAEDAYHQPRVDRREFCSPLSAVGNLGYERMPCCGYDPQKRTFACPIRIERSTGFGAPFSGSREYVLTCVDLGAGLEPVALDTVHLSNAVSGAPPWQFAVLAKASPRLSNLPLNGKTLRARSILSWNLAPTDCNYKAYWGHALDYQIRLDP